ncbi:hypothetical protein COOONC_00231, partial [Cooperia oncophora]
TSQSIVFQPPLYGGDENKDVKVEGIDKGTSTARSMGAQPTAASSRPKTRKEPRKQTRQPDIEIEPRKGAVEVYNDGDIGIAICPQEA